MRTAENVPEPAVQTLLLIFNGGEELTLFKLPSIPESGVWTWRVNTVHAQTLHKPVKSKTVEIAARSLALLEYRQVP